MSVVSRIIKKGTRMMSKQRVYLIVLDSFGIGHAPDAADFGDEGANTLYTITHSKEYDTPNMRKLGLSCIDGVDYLEKSDNIVGSYGRMQEASKGKDTTIGHWEIAGIVSENALPTYPNGFPKEVLDEFSKRTGREVLCNKPYSGTDVIRDYGEEHVRTGKLIVYTSADSVFQIAAHEDIVPVEELYKYCEIAREILVGEHGVGRVIARPFVGEAPNFQRTTNRHDFSLLPPRDTMLDVLQKEGYDTYGVGKIYDIFAGKGIAHTQRIQGNVDGMEKTIQLQDKDFNGLCFVNLVDFDMLYGHRNDIEGYAKAATVFDKQLGTFMERMQPQDILMITADHGCDPGFKGTDHSRECVPFLAYGEQVKKGVNMGTRKTFSDIAATILDIFGIDSRLDGTSFKDEILK
ncbi:phosphopentomutase [Blautia hansenii DSM 20583]|uniref:Phosphopentomutase n=3 Tax=Blautia hansenii TaxID=1322 RepID=C9L492_BLAHA|nr:phosphopentomutase [Blautia hansenii DSM 20583]